MKYSSFVYGPANKVRNRPFGTQEIWMGCLNVVMINRQLRRSWAEALPEVLFVVAHKLNDFSATLARQIDLEARSSQTKKENKKYIPMRGIEFETYKPHQSRKIKYIRLAQFCFLTFLIPFEFWLPTKWKKHVTHSNFEFMFWESAHLPLLQMCGMPLKCRPVVFKLRYLILWWQIFLQFTSVCRNSLDETTGVPNSKESINTNDLCTRIEQDVTALSSRCYVTHWAIENMSALQGTMTGR